MVKVTIDDVQIEVEPGTTILNAARQIGGDVVPPAMCFYSKLPGTEGNVEHVWWKWQLVLKKTRVLCQN